MQEVFDELPVRTQVLAVAGFFVLVGMFFGVPRALGHHWLWDHSRLVGPILGLAYFGLVVRALARRSRASADPDRNVRSGLSPDGPPLLAGPGPGHSLALPLLHRRARWALTRWWGTIAALVLTVVALPVGLHSTSSANRLIDSQPHQKVRVLDVHGSGGDLTVTVSIPDDGPEDVEYPDYLSPRPHVGDQVEVVANPDDYTEVIPVAYRHSSYNTPLASLGIWAAILVMIAWVGWRMGATKRAAAKAVRTSTSTTRVTVVAADEGFTVTTPDGQRLTWVLVGDHTDRTPPVGTTLDAAGDVRPGGWAAAKYRHWVLWTHKPLTIATPPA
jgi:hypothetical protein